MESGEMYLLHDVRMELIDLYVEGRDDPFNFIEMSIDYEYADDSGEATVMPMPPLLLDMDNLVELSAIIARSLVRLEDANPMEIVGWASDQDEDYYEDYDPNSGPELD